MESRSSKTLERLLFVIVMLFVWGLDTHGNFAGSGDERHYEMMAHSIVFDRDLDLSNDYADRTNLLFDKTLEIGGHALVGRGGHLRPVHDIGLPVLFAPYFAVAYEIADSAAQWIPPRIMARAKLNPWLVLRHLLSLAMVTVTALMGVLLFRTCAFGQDRRAPAFLWTLLFVLSPPLLSHSYLFFTEIPTACIVTICWLALSTRMAWSRLRAVLLGAAVGFLLLLHIRNLGLVVGMAALFLERIRHQDRRTEFAAWFIAPVAGFTAIRTVVNVAFWGALITNPHASLAPSTIGATLREVTIRSFGLLTDQEHGLLPYAPVYLLVLPGVFVLWKTNRRVLAEAAVVVLGYLIPVLLPFLNRHGWDGGWSPAARFLVPVAPVFVAVGFHYVSRLERVPRTMVFVCFLQVVLDLVYWSHPMLLWNDTNTGSSALAAAASFHRIDVGAFLPCWHFPTPYTVVVSVLAVTLWAAFSTHAATRLTRKVAGPSHA